MSKSMRMYANASKMTFHRHICKFYSHISNIPARKPSKKSTLLNLHFLKSLTRSSSRVKPLPLILPLPLIPRCAEMETLSFALPLSTLVVNQTWVIYQCFLGSIREQLLISIIHENAFCVLHKSSQAFMHEYLSMWLII